LQKPFPQKISSQEVEPQSMSEASMRQVQNAHYPLVCTRLNAATGTHPGISRKHKPNEDSLFALHGSQTWQDDIQPFGLFVIADGMGGHACGQEASLLATRMTSNTIVPMLLGNAELGHNALFDLLRESVRRANDTIYHHNRQQNANMGTTLMSALLVGSTAYIANVGDSRTYLYREQTFTQVTRDHSVVARLVEACVITPDEAYTHPKRNQLYRNIGEHPEVEVDLFTVSLQSGDKLLLCSDGLWEMVHEPEIQHIMGTPAAEPSHTVDTLIRAALKGGGRDNVSVIVVLAQ